MNGRLRIPSVVIRTKFIKYGCPVIMYIALLNEMDAERITGQFLHFPIQNDAPATSCLVMIFVVSLPLTFGASI